jgi:MYXO-CTERM domain-containing protein
MLLADGSNMPRLLNLSCHLVPNSQKTLIACALLAVMTVERSAEACSTEAPIEALVGYPADGEVGIPTDVSPFYRLNYPHFNLAEAGFELVSSDGTAVPVSVEPVTFGSTSGVNLRTAAPLEPETSYTLEASTTAAPFDTVTFTTGEGPVSELPPVPAAALTHYKFVPTLLIGCAPSQTGTCMSFPGGLVVETTLIDEFGQEHPHSIERDPFFLNVGGFDQATPFRCVEVRTRAANGSFGEPGVFCASDAPLYKITGSGNIACAPDGLLHDGAVVAADEPLTESSSAGGCGVAKSETSNDHTLLATFVALASLARRRRRSVSSS